VQKTLLNYLEGVAIGIFQNIYVEQMAGDYLQEIVEKQLKPDKGRIR
jgi:hypothetical protein